LLTSSIRKRSQAEPSQVTSALIIDIPEGSFDEIVHAVRQAKAMIALNSMRRKAAKTGFMSDDEIESLIDEARNGG